MKKLLILLLLPALLFASDIAGDANYVTLSSFIDQFYDKAYDVSTPSSLVDTDLLIDHINWAGRDISTESKANVRYDTLTTTAGTQRYTLSGDAFDVLTVAFRDDVYGDIALNRVDELVGYMPQDSMRPNSIIEWDTISTVAETYWYLLSSGSYQVMGAYYLNDDNKYIPLQYVEMFTGEGTDAPKFYTVGVSGDSLYLGLEPIKESGFAVVVIYRKEILSNYTVGIAKDSLFLELEPVNNTGDTVIVKYAARWKTLSETTDTTNLAIRYHGALMERVIRQIFFAKKDERIGVMGK